MCSATEAQIPSHHLPSPHEVATSAVLVRHAAFAFSESSDSVGKAGTTTTATTTSPGAGTSVADTPAPQAAFTGLHDINLVVAPGELVAVVGVVGSGKTSLLHAILGLMVRKAGFVGMRGASPPPPVPCLLSLMFAVSGC